MELKLVTTSAFALLSCIFVSVAFFASDGSPPPRSSPGLSFGRPSSSTSASRPMTRSNRRHRRSARRLAKDDSLTTLI
ncbi:hypothetical protein L596_005326 [Steinernema carpocapsae]|uniref:Uncharacterized protein n=1 Tax=Steinernema carpocapsae TaxID=34508 RepID=A0A4U8V084_STECR|nr:hypothetical protein L596_005326 [Steinernema carpocapsae]